LPKWIMSDVKQFKFYSGEIVVENPFIQTKSLAWKLVNALELCTDKARQDPVLAEQTIRWILDVVPMIVSKSGRKITLNTVIEKDGEWCKILILRHLTYFMAKMDLVKVLPLMKIYTDQGVLDAVAAPRDTGAYDDMRKFVDACSEIFEFGKETSKSAKGVVPNVKRNIQKIIQNVTSIRIPVDVIDPTDVRGDNFYRLVAYFYAHLDQYINDNFLTVNEAWFVEAMEADKTEARIFMRRAMSRIGSANYTPSDHFGEDAGGEQKQCIVMNKLDLVRARLKNVEIK